MSERIDLYKADVDTLVRVAGQTSIWYDRWHKGDDLPGEDLQEFINRSVEGMDEKLIYKSSSVDQMLWVRDKAASAFYAGDELMDSRTRVHVIGTHTSKSCTLPVYRMERTDIGLRIYLRNNFHNWKLSVDSIRPVNVDFTGLFLTSPPDERARKYNGDQLASCYFEGFPESVIFGYYGASDGRRWSAEIGTRESLYTVLFLMMRSFGMAQRREYTPEDQHRRLLDTDTARHILRDKHPDVQLPPLRVMD